jgi:general secretion pathway protein B
MSYILEALKKSDKKRQQETSVSPLHKIHAKPPALRKKEPQRGRQISLSITLVLVIAGLTIWYLSKKDTPTLTAEKPKTEEVLPLKPQAQPEITVVPKPIPELRPAKKKVYVASTESQPEVIPKSVEVVLEPKPLTAVAPPPPPFDEYLQTDNKTPYLEELPASFQETVPQFQFDGHVFSPEPQQRMIMINRKIVRQGEVIEKGFILDEITPSGVILRHSTERFQMKAY